jgi:hypothetical protein
MAHDPRSDAGQRSDAPLYGPCSLSSLSSCCCCSDSPRSILWHGSCTSAETQQALSELCKKQSLIEQAVCWSTCSLRSHRVVCAVCHRSSAAEDRPGRHPVAPCHPTLPGHANQHVGTGIRRRCHECAFHVLWIELCCLSHDTHIWMVCRCVSLARTCSRRRLRVEVHYPCAWRCTGTPTPSCS